MIKKLLFFSILMISFNSFSQEWNWSIKATGDNQQYMGMDMAVDTEGNMVVAGYFQGNLSLGDFAIYSPDEHFADLYLTKINADKEVVWIKTFEGGYCYGDYISLTIDDDENIYLTGNIDEKIFVSKFDKVGNQLWYNDFDRDYYGYGRSIALDQFDNVYVAGGNGSNFFMSKLNYEGEEVWIKNIPFSYTNAINLTDINVDRLGNIYFTGVFDYDEIILDGFVLEETVNSGDETFWGKMDTDGNILWIKSAQGKTINNPQIALTADGHLFLGGSLYVGITFDGIYIEGICCSNAKPFIAKYDIEGNVIWAKAGFSTLQEKGTTTDIKVDYEGNLYLTGSYFTCNPCTVSDIYLEGYNNDGDHLWRKEFVMTSYDFTKAIDIDNHGYAYYVGYNQSETFIDENLFSPTNTLGVAQLNTFSSTYKKTPRPQIERLHTICELGVNITLNATGNNVKWYDDPNLNNLVFEGNSFAFQTNESLKLYVTQTVNNIPSWPKEVIVNISELDAAQLTFDDPRLIATYNPLFDYQWYYMDEVLENRTNNFITITPGTDFSDYGVLIKQQDCEIALGRLVLSVDSNEVISELYLYPNPTSGIIKILGNSASSLHNVAVFNNLGQVVLSVGNASEIDITALNVGLYFVKLTDSNGNIVVKKILKE